MSVSRLLAVLVLGAVTLVSQMPNGQVLLAAGSQLECRVVSASGTAVAAGHLISLHGQPDPLVPALVEHRSVEGSLTPERARAWGQSLAARRAASKPDAP